ncbi:MAG TPA: glycosyltransferase family 39 protein [Candidatus Levybacteria bacterium]|nr:glycosyltransferase family 39 protein [Candidatus Levybacteria bacterium]
MKILYKNIYILIPLFIFTILIIPFVTVIPLRDGNIDFVKSYYFLKGGFPLYFSQFNSIHPPLKEVISALIFQIAGVHSVTYSLLGYITGIIGIISAYYIGKRMIDKTFAIFFSVALSIQPLFISTAVFALTDYLLTCFLLLCCALFLAKKRFLFSLSLTLLILTKETGLIALLSFFIIDTFPIKKTFLKNLSFLFPYGLPASAYLLWSLFLHISGKSAWKDYIFSETAQHGSFYTIINNLLFFKFINFFFLTHALQVLFLNFLWVLLLITFFFLFRYLIVGKNRQNFKLFITSGSKNSRLFLFMFLFSAIYTLCILTFQTFTIPRYELPIIPFLLFLSLTAIWTIKNKYVKLFFLYIFFMFLIVGLFFSTDIIGKHIWGTHMYFGQKIYNTEKTISGNDGATYNIQFLFASRSRTMRLKWYKDNDTPVPFSECKVLFPDPKNDRITMQLFGFENISSCLKSPQVNW